MIWIFVCVALPFCFFSLIYFICLITGIVLYFMSSMPNSSMYGIPSSADPFSLTTRNLHDYLYFYTLLLCYILLLVKWMGFYMLLKQCCCPWYLPELASQTQHIVISICHLCKSVCLSTFVLLCMGENFQWTCFICGSYMQHTSLI